MTALHGHENCDNTRFETRELNLAIDALNEWIKMYEPKVAGAVGDFVELAEREGMDSPTVTAAAKLISDAVATLSIAYESHDCLMTTIKDRAYAEKLRRENGL